MLANNMLLSDVKPSPDAAKELSVRSNDVSNRDSASHHQKDDFNQVMQRSKSDQLKQEQIRQEQAKQKQQQSQQRQADLDKQSDIQKTQKLDAQKQHAERADANRLDARASEERKQAPKSQAEEQAQDKAQHSDKPKQTEQLAREEQAKTDTVKSDALKEQAQKLNTDSDSSDEPADDKLLTGFSEKSLAEHDCECDKTFGDMAKQMLPADSEAQNKEQPKEHKDIDTRWLDTVIDIVSNGQKGTEQLSESEGNELAAKQEESNEKPLKSIEQLLAELKQKSNDSDANINKDAELAKQAELAVLKAMESKLANEQGVADKQDVVLEKDDVLDEKVTQKSADNKLMSLSQLIQQEQANLKLDSEVTKLDQAQLQQAKLQQAEVARINAEIEANKTTLNASGVNALSEQKPSDKASSFDKSQLLELELNQKRQIQRQSLLAQEALPGETKTKVMDFGTGPVLNNAANKLANGQLAADGSNELAGKSNKFSTDLEQEMRSAMQLDEVKTPKAVDQKLMDTLSASLLESGVPKVNTNDIKTEKVDVAGVTVDKTLQMPKLESIANAKTDVIIRENILFNKQELANHMQQQIGIMLAKNMKSLDMRMDPPDLGAMQVRLSVSNDQATVSFVVSNQQTKDALEASMPKLREMLEQQGVELAESNVQQDNGQQQKDMSDGESSGQGSQGVNGEDGDEEMLDADRNRATVNSPWNVSYYA